jgi:hypothetical protein
MTGSLNVVPLRYSIVLLNLKEAVVFEGIIERTFPCLFLTYKVLTKQGKIKAVVQEVYGGALVVK